MLLHDDVRVLLAAVVSSELVHDEKAVLDVSLFLRRVLSRIKHFRNEVLVQVGDGETCILVSKRNGVGYVPPRPQSCDVER